MNTKKRIAQDRQERTQRRNDERRAERERHARLRAEKKQRANGCPPELAKLLSWDRLNRS